MRALVVYESMFGNTAEVAHEIAAGLASHGDVELRPVTAAPREVDRKVDLVVVGGPTHSFSMSRATTREDAIAKGATEGSRDFGIRDWLARLHAGSHHATVATFDTRAIKVRHLPGSAARSAARSARRHGYPHVVAAESFYVEDIDGPLEHGELERARRWGEHLGAELKLAAARPAR